MPGSRSGDSAEMKAVFRPLLLLAITVFIDLLGFGLVLPNLPQYVELAVGRNHAQAASIAGMLGASYSLTQFIFAPLWGRYSDKVGRRPVILISLIGVAGAYTLFGLAGRHLWMLFAARLLAGVLSSASIGVAFAYVADVTSPENRARGIGLLGACFGLGFMLGPAFGGILGHIQISLPAFVAAGIALVNFGFAIRFLPESLTTEARRKATEAGKFTPWLLLRVIQGPAGFLFALSFLVILAFSALEQSFGYYLLAVKEFHVSNRDQPLVNGTILGAVGLVSIIVQGGLIGRLVKRFGEGGLVVVGIALMVVGFAFFALPKSLVLLTVGPMMVLSIGRAIFQPSLSALVSRKANMGQGLTLSTSSSFDALARTFGPLLGGFLFRALGPAAPYTSAAVIMAVALLLGLLKRRDMAINVPLDNPMQGV